ncbi:hypothetical protein ACJJTC_019230 [Scirpophaga incertulas]
MSSPLVASAAYILFHYVLDDYRRPPRFWESDIYKKRRPNSLVLELKYQELSGHYKNFMRMSSSNFEYLYNLILPAIQKQDTRFRKAISAQDKLALTLRFLATGDSFTSLQYLFKISKKAISKFIPKVCQAIINGLKDNVKLPNNPQEWLKIADAFDELWNFPHCIGAVDGKHVVLQAPVNSGTEFYNYKGNFSIVLFILADANYQIKFVDVGCQGRISNGGVYKNTKLYSLMVKDKLNLPTPTPLEGRDKVIPYFLLGDSAFALTKNMLKPFPGQTHAKGTLERVFNYRLSRARRVVENVFGIMAQVFRVLRKPLMVEPDKAAVIVLTIAHLHNYLRAYSDTYSSGIRESESLREDYETLQPIRNCARRAPDNTKEIRKELGDYFLKEGAILFQNNY